MPTNTHRCKHTSIAQLAAKGMICLVLTCSYSTWLNAAEYMLQPSVLVSSTYNNNVSFSSLSDSNDPLQQNNDIAGLIYRPKLDIERNTELSSLTVSGDLSFNRFNLTQYDSDDQSLNINYRRQFKKGSIYGGSLWRKETSRTFEDEDTGDGSLARTAVRAQATQLTAGGTYSLSENQIVQGSLFALRQDYETLNLIDYTYLSASGLWQYALSERYRLQTNTSYSRYLPRDRVGRGFTDAFFTAVAEEGLTQAEIEDEILECRLSGTNMFFIPNATNPTSQGFCEAIFDGLETVQSSAQLQMGLVINISEKTSIDVLLGGNQTGTKSDSPNNLASPVSRSKDNSLSYEATFSHRGERLSFTLEGTRKDETTANGGLRLTQRVTATSRWSLTQHNQIKASFIWFDKEQTTTANNTATNISFDQETQISRISYHHRFSAHWSGIAQYQYRQQENKQSNLTNNNDRRYRSEALLTLVWRPQKTQW